MNLEEFKKLPQTKQREIYSNLKAKRDSHYKLMKHRCDSDVDINVALWEDLKGRLVRMFTYIKDQIDSGEVDNKRVSGDEFMYLDSLKGLSVEQHIDRYLTFMMSKADKARLREKTKIKIDKELLKDTDEKLEALLKEAADKLEAVMPKVPKYNKKSKPKKPFLKSGELSASGLSWNEAIEGLNKVDELGNKLTLVVEDDENSVKVLKKYEEPNINSTDQIKKWLFSHGWKPKTFKFVKDKEAQQAWADSGFKKELKPKPRQIPQLSVDGEEGKELCPSVLELANKVPEIEAYSGYTLLKHRYDVIQGFKNALVDDLYVRAEVGGLTNTLREKHRVPVVNLPSVSRPWGKEIRGLLIAGKGQTMLGSDLSSLEDRVKNHFCLAHDPAYVESISVDGYDAHVHMCEVAGFINKEERDAWYTGDKRSSVKEVRSLGKTVNYSCLPVDNTEVLTLGGWKRFEDLAEGDAILSYDTVKDCIEEDTILKKHFFKNTECVTFSNHNYDIESTLNHRWYGWARSRSNNETSKVWGFKQTGEFNSEFNILNTSVYKGNLVGSISKEDAGFLGWLLSDGYYKWSEDTKKTSSSFGKKRGVIMSVSQAEHKYLEEVRQSIEAAGLSYSEDVRYKNYKNPLHNFHISSESAREFLDRVSGSRKGKHENDWTKVVLKMSEDARQSFLYNFWLADVDSLGRGFTKSPVITQNEGNIFEAVRLAMYLSGFRTNVNTKDRKCKTLRGMRSQWVTCQRLKETRRRLTDVFCLTTNNSTFIMKQGDFISITGNCVYGAGPETIARSGGISLEDAKKLHKAYWKVHAYVKSIADDQFTFACDKGHRWLINPINGFPYSIRAEKDIFSTLIQGTGSYFFDIWVDNVIEEMHNLWGVSVLQGCIHDELFFSCKDSSKIKSKMEEIVKQSIYRVNSKFKLRVNLDCDVQWGKSYAEIH